MPMLEGPAVIYGIHPHVASSDQRHPLGTLGVASDGRKYRYAQAAGIALAPGLLCIAADITTNHEDRAVNTFAIGDKSITVGIGGTAITTGEYTEGYVNITDELGQGIMYKIRSHETSSSGSEDVIITLEEPIRVAATADTTVTLVRNKYRDILVSDGTITDLPVGVPNVTITEDYYGWLQTGGYCSILVDNTDTTAGSEITIGDTTTGGVETRATVERTVGIQPAGANADVGEYGVYDLTLD